MHTSYANKHDDFSCQSIRPRASFAYRNPRPLRRHQMMSTQAARKAEAERRANSVLVMDHGASDTITKAAAASGVSKGVLRWDESDNGYRINDPHTWADVDFLS